jgi:predicted alpha/beta hydrolase family esterase
MKPVVIICPGNGCSNIRTSNWYGTLYNILKEKQIECVCENFPDPIHARRDKWIPFIHSIVERYDKGKTNIILVGHSSGAQAILRYTEQYPVHASVLVSATYSDLGDAHERMSGYYPQQQGKNGEKSESNPYLFGEMKKNCKIWHQFHSDDDPWISVSEAEAIRNGLGITDTYYLLSGRSHYFEFQPELLDVILSLC